MLLGCRGTLWSLQAGAGGVSPMVCLGCWPPEHPACAGEGDRAQGPTAVLCLGSSGIWLGVWMLPCLGEPEASLGTFIFCCEYRAGRLTSVAVVTVCCAPWAFPAGHKAGTALPGLVWHFWVELPFCWLPFSRSSSMSVC